MYNLVRADLYKVSRSTYIKALFLISTICATIMILMAYLIPQGRMNPNFADLGLMFSDAHIMSVIGAVTAGILICGDMNNKVIHDLIASGHSRGKVIISKTLVLCLVIGFILLPYAIVVGIGFTTGNVFSMGDISVGFLGLLADSGKTLTASNVLKLVIVMITLMGVYISQLSITILLGFKLKKPLYIVGLYYGFGGICAQLLLLEGKFPQFDRLFALTPYGGRHILLTLDTPWTSIIRTILIIVLYIVVIVSLTNRLFKKAEIK